tara:strand:- start:6374 stop:6835 length:462 start_codon:yes stop_codon:yes gene_type:complete
MTQTEEYHLYPLNKDCIYTTEYWNNQLSNGKPVTVLYVQQWRNGEFTIELDEKEKAIILTNDKIILNDWGACTEEISSGWFYETKIKNEETFDQDEKKEIHRLMFCDNENEEEYCCDDLNFDNFEQYIMEANDWSMDDTIYEIVNGCELEIMS